MSGIEVVGILLGAFPLIISAMEHYEDQKRVLGTFWRIRKSHRKDLGKVKDCQLKFKLNMKELLLPLLLDQVVDKIEYEQLLAHPGGPGWKEEGVEEALASRLSESHSRYIEILEEMTETMAKLSKAVKVDDPQFQALLTTKSQPETNAKQAAQKILMTRANLQFQAKRVKYSFSGTGRDALLNDVDKYNQTLESLLTANDRVSALSQGPGQHPPTRKIASKILQYFRHAERIFSLIREAFECSCRSMHCAHIMLAHRPAGAVDMSLMLKYSQEKISTCPPWDERAMLIRLAGKLSQTPNYSLQSSPKMGLGHVKKSSFSIQSTSSASGSTTSFKTVDSAMYMTTTTSAITLTATKTQQFTSSSDSLPDLKRLGLCQTVGHSADDTNLGVLIDDDNDANYTVISATTVPSSGSVTVGNALSPSYRPVMTRAQRYSIALAIASSHLQLHSTPWLKGEWTVQDIYLPLLQSADGNKLRTEPYLLAGFENATFAKEPKDRSFATLGVVLLELCFGRLLDDHYLWQQPGFSQGQTNPIIRQAVASEWLQDVPGEAGPDYAAAVEWTLRSAPAISSGVRDEKWRSEFATNVVQPLQRCYESMKPL